MLGAGLLTWNIATELSLKQKSIKKLTNIAKNKE